MTDIAMIERVELLTRKGALIAAFDVPKLGNYILDSLGLFA
jgi:hypothetical protein